MTVINKPIPTPRPGEPAKHFLDRCMSNPTMVREYPNRAQRYAICNTQLRRRKIENEIESRGLDIQKEMSRQDWLDAWKKDPHWADSMKPSPLSKYLVTEMKKNDLTGPILEIGCGNGRDSIYFGKQGYDVTGIDVSPDAIKIAKEKNDLSNVNFKVGDAEKLDFSNDLFDAVYSISVLHSTDLKKSVSELSRVLRETGISVLYLYNKSTYENGEDEINFKIGELEKIFKTNKLHILDKWRNTLKDKDEEGEHIHHIIVYLLQEK